MEHYKINIHIVGEPSGGNPAPFRDLTGYYTKEEIKEGIKFTLEIENPEYRKVYGLTTVSKQFGLWNYGTDEKKSQIAFSFVKALIKEGY